MALSINSGSNTKVRIVLNCKDDEQKAHAYQIMGFHLLQYRSNHVVDFKEALELMKHGYITDYIKVNVMY